MRHRFPRKQLRGIERRCESHVLFEDCSADHGRTAALQDLGDSLSLCLGALLRRLRRAFSRLAYTEIGCDHQMCWRAFCPVAAELLVIEERHIVYSGVTVTAGGGDESVDLGPVGFATASASPCLRPDPVSTVISTALALLMSSMSSTASGRMSG